MSNAELLERAAQAATCQVLSSAGYSLVGAGAVSLWAGGTGLVPITAGGISLLASNYLCPDMPLGGANPPSDQIDGCDQMQPGSYGQSQYKLPGGDWQDMLGQWLYSQAFRLGNTPANQQQDGRWVSQCEVYTANDGTTFQTGSFDTEAEAKSVSYRILPTNGECGSSSGGLPPVPPEAYEPIEYTDNITNCNYTVQLQGFAQIQEGGEIQPVYQIEGVSALTRADGGRMGGCNFPPTIYVPPGGGGGGGGGGTYLPVPDDGPPPGPGGDLPWWAGPLAGAVAGAVLNQIAESINDLLAPYFEESEFTLVAPCDKDDAGNPLVRTWTFPAQREPERLVSHQVALMEIMQQHLDWKTPTCGGSVKPKLEGTWISTRWVSDGNSPAGERPLRKLFRYRSKSTRTPTELTAYWSGFTWSAGPVLVIHHGGWWGNPQVWAASEEEGKRVLRFAAGEAGIDPDAVGKWSLGTSSSTRYGMTGNMRLAEEFGEQWVTRRDGPNGVPVPGVDP